MPSAVRLLAVDIDGTLLDSRHQLPARNREALEAANAAGIEIVLVTGRRFDFALPIALELSFDHVLIASNGAVVKSRAGVTYFRRLLPANVAAQAIECTRPWRGYTLLAFDCEGEGQIVMESLENRTESFRSWYERNRSYVRFQGLEEALAGNDGDPLQVMYSGPMAVLEEVERALLQAPFRSGFKMMKTLYPQRDLGIVDLIHPSCSKGAALLKWAEFRNFSRHQVMAVGDNHNDLEMLEFAGLPVVMGNAVEELKSNGWLVTGDNDSGGLAEAIARWALPERK